MSGRRARGVEEKRARRRQLLDAAGERLDRAGFAATTMAEVAESAGLAKGTTYLYFRSKEALFLELLLEAVAEWSGRAAAELVALRDDRAEALAALLARSVAARPRLAALLPLRHPVLEQGAAPDEVERFERLQLEALGPLALGLEERSPALGLGGGLGLLMRFLALAAGLAGLAAAESPTRRAVEARPEAARLARAYEAELAESVAALLRGWRAAAGDGSAQRS